MAIHVFPLELRASQKDWPHMLFMPNGSGEMIYFPIPMGLTFSDSMQYSSLDLKILGDIGAAAIGAAANSKQGSGVVRKTGNAITAATGATLDKIKSANLAAAASIAARTARQDDVANVIDYATKQVVAPNTRTTFQNSSIRKFSFSFKMVGRTKDDTAVIDRICQIFQHYMYPEGNDLIMKYPPTWRILFFDGLGNKNANIPGIYECYLTDFTQTFNSSTNIFHEDGSPLETDVSLGFEETKALTRQEIMALRGIEYNDGQPDEFRDGKGQPNRRPNNFG